MAELTPYLTRKLVIFDNHVIQLRGVVAQMRRSSSAQSKLESVTALAKVNITLLKNLDELARESHQKGGIVDAKA